MPVKCCRMPIGWRCHTELNVTSHEMSQNASWRKMPHCWHTCRAFESKRLSSQNPQTQLGFSWRAFHFALLAHLVLRQIAIVPVNIDCSCWLTWLSMHGGCRLFFLWLARRLQSKFVRKFIDGCEEAKFSIFLFFLISILARNHCSMRIMPPLTVKSYSMVFSRSLRYFAMLFLDTRSTYITSKHT